MGVEHGPRSTEERRERAREIQQRARERATERAGTRERATTYDVRGGGFRPRTTTPRRRRWGLILVSLAVIAITAYFVLPLVLGGLFRALAEENPDLMRVPFIADSVRDAMGDRPDRPAGTDPTPVDFVIQQGASSRQIIEDLVDRELVTDRLAFMFVLVSEDGLGNLQAGTHTLNRTMTPRVVAHALQQTPGPVVRSITIALRDGLRIEQVTALLLTIPDLPFEPADFYELAIAPSAELVADYPMLALPPAGSSLEGFLAAGVFDVPLEADAEAFLRLLLDTREAELAPLISQPPPAPLTDFFQVMTVASIVEAETRVETERATIAGVYVNRLDQAKWPTRLLNADPTVIYGNDTELLREQPLVQWVDYVFWAPPGSGMGDVALSPELAGFQTYHHRGIPPWPIRTPSVASIEAVLNADTASGYLFFVAKGDGTGGHAFAKTFEEHQRNIQLYLNSSEPSPADTALPTALPTAAPSP